MAEPQNICELVSLIAPAAIEGETAPGAPHAVDLDALRASLAVPRERGAFLPGNSPFTTSWIGARTAPYENPFALQRPIYLLPGQASAQGEFLVGQQMEPILPAFLRRIIALRQKGA